MRLTIDVDCWQCDESAEKVARTTKNGITSVVGTCGEHHDEWCEKYGPKSSDKDTKNNKN